jgi:hypothetical protein
MKPDPQNHALSEAIAESLKLISLAGRVIRDTRRQISSTRLQTSALRRTSFRAER